MAERIVEAWVVLMMPRGWAIPRRSRLFAQAVRTEAVSATLVRVVLMRVVTVVL